MLDNFFLLKEVSKFLKKEIIGYTIKEIFTQEKDKLVISLINPESSITKFIEFSSNDKIPYLLLKDEYNKAKKNVLNLLAGLYEQEISDVEIFNNDRIIKLTLTNDLSVFFIFFKSKYNLLVVADGKIIDSFKNKKEIVGTNINDYLEKKMTKSKKNSNTVKEYYSSYYRHYGDLVFRETIFLLNIKGEEKINNELKELIDKRIEIINNRLNSPEYLIHKNKSEFLPALFKMNHLENCEMLEFKSINDLVQGYLKFYYSISFDREIRKNVLLKKENALKNSEKKYYSLTQQLEFSKNSEQFKVYGDLILSNIHMIKKGDETLVLDGIEYPENIQITLKKDLSPPENAAIYYEKYKKHKNSIELLNEKIKKQINEIDILKKEIEDIINKKDLKSLKMVDKEFNKTDESSGFRKFTLDDKFEVWVGKDSASNDLLTTRFSSQNDLWFHVRGASGSHTVLKISDKKIPPDKKVIGKAASIAAYYSKARNASNVPVAYCEKKYVKKKKGFKEGSVVMEREKVVFVKPGLPE
ncbi:MAG: NFACT RNA binding domain-containing protein, partial [Ignavibacteriae bacterium]|nr:NFACT RNA binding domain-containing protein [Ignavibacteriota bacterium]